MSNLPDVEKDHAGHDSVNGNGMKYDLHHDLHDEDTALRRLRTAGSLTISPELFEKIYLSPKNQVSNNIRSTFGNPTPLYVHAEITCHTSNLLLVPLSAFCYLSHLYPISSWAGEALVVSELLKCK
jgi:hypothetical protein